VGFFRINLLPPLEGYSLSLKDIFCIRLNVLPRNGEESIRNTSQCNFDV
jgi:hypothetical protein